MYLSLFVEYVRVVGLDLCFTFVVLTVLLMNLCLCRLQCICAGRSVDTILKAWSGHMHACVYYLWNIRECVYVCVCVCECNEAGGIQVSLTCRVHVALTRHFMCSQCI
jgi:hypothetical protein